MTGSLGKWVIWSFCSLKRYFTFMREWTLKRSFTFMQKWILKRMFYFSDVKWIFKISFFSCRRCPKDNVKFQLRIRCIISYNKHVCAFITLAFIVFLYTLYDQGENNRGIENVKTECTSVRERKKIGGLQWVI